MKKIIIATLALCFGLGAYAKTLAELRSELGVYSESLSAETKAERRAYIRANSEDLLREFDEWKGKDIAKFYADEEPNKSLTDEQKAEATALRNFFGSVYWTFAPDCPANTGLRLAVSVYLANVETVNPTFYKDLKAAGFEIDGVKLPEPLQIRIAAYCGDLDYFANLDFDKADKGTLFDVATLAKKMLVGAEDVDKAATVCASYKRALVMHGATSASSALAQIKVAEMFLNEAILNKQIRSK